MACIPSHVIQIPHGGELAVERVVKLIGEQGKRVAHGNVLRAYSDHVDELAQQRQDHLRRGVHVVQPAHHVVRLGIDRSADNATHQVHFDGDLLPLLISNLPVAVGLVEVLDQGMPCGSIVGLATELANHPGHHAFDHSLVGMIAFPPVSLSWARPVGRARVVRPDDAPRMKAFGDANGLVRNRVVSQHHLVAGCPKGAADSRGHRVCGPQHARRYHRATDHFDEFTTIASMSHFCLPTGSA
jgi:hypothetical protein